MTTFTTFTVQTAGPADAELLLWRAEPEALDPSLSRLNAAMTGRPTHGPAWLDLAATEADPRRLALAVTGASMRDQWMSLGGDVFEAMKDLHLESLRLPHSNAFGSPDAFDAFLTGVLLHGFRLNQGRRTPALAAAPETLVIDARDRGAADDAVARVLPINRARAWVEQPANLLTPEIFAREAEQALTPLGVAVSILGREALTALGAHALLAVGSGSHNPPCLVVAEWRGDPNREGWDAALVGKGVTFDSGGLNLKVRPIIEKMKFDMGGAAGVLGALEAAAARKAPVNVVVVVPMTENSIGSNAYRPGDVIGSLDGLTIEVQNTDAEGRLVLADGVTYALQNYAPTHIVDVATLTGLITGVLHEEFAGLFTADDDLARSLTAAGDAVGEYLWRLPLTTRQAYLVDSSVADLANMGAPGLLGVGGGSPVAGAQFIQRFARGASWAHLDVAGVAWPTRRTHRSGPGASGFGVALLDRWLDSLAPEGREEI